MSTLVGLIKQAASEANDQKQPATALFGTVISNRPLIIETDQKLTLTHEFLVLTRNVTDYETIISFDNPAIKQKITIFDKPEDEPVIKPSNPAPIPVTVTDIQFNQTNYRIGNNNGNEKAGLQPTRHTITVYQALAIGERVILVKEAGGQRYYVFDRVGVMTPEEGGEV